MKFPTLSASTRTTTMLAAVAAVLFFATIMTYMVCSGHLRSVALELQDKQKQVDDSTKIAMRLNDAEQSYLQAQGELGYLETSVATHAYVPTLLEQLERLGREMDLRVVSVRPQVAPPPPPRPIKRTSEDPQAAPETSSKGTQSAEKPQLPKPYEELIIDVELEGTYWHARNFLYRLTSFPKVVAVKQIQMAPVNMVARRGSPRLSVKLNVVAFVFPASPVQNEQTKPAPPPAATTKAATLSRRSNDEG